MTILLLAFCLSSCQPDEGIYPSESNGTNDIGPYASDVTGLFNVYQLVNNNEVIELGIQEITYDRKENELISIKRYGGDELESGTVQWRCFYTSQQNPGTFFRSSSGFVSKLNCTIDIMDQNLITIKSPSFFKPITLVRRLVESR